MPEALAIAPEAFGAVDLGLEGLGAVDLGVTAAEGLDLGATAAEGLGAAAEGASAFGDFGATAADVATNTALASDLATPVSASADLAPMDPNLGFGDPGATTGLQAELAPGNVGPQAPGLGGGSELAQLQPIQGVSIDQPAAAPGIDFAATDPLPAAPVDLTGGGQAGIATDLIAGNVGDLGVDTGGFSANFGAGEVPFSGDILPGTGDLSGGGTGLASSTGDILPGPGDVPPDISMSQGTFQGLPQGGQSPLANAPPDATTALETMGNETAPGHTITTTTGAGGKGGSGLFGGAGGLGQLAALGGLGIAALRGPGPLPSAGVSSEALANQLAAQGSTLRQRALANEISPAQAAELQTIRDAAINRLVQQIAAQSPGGQIDPKNDSRYVFGVQEIDKQLAANYQQFVNDEFNQGIQDTQLAQGGFGTVLNAQFRNNEDFNRALFAAAQASSALLGGGGGGTTTTTTVT